jgi:hypothetical protein
MTHRAFAVPQYQPEAPGSGRAAQRPAPSKRSSSIPIEETIHGSEAPQRRGAEAWRGSR